MRRSRDVRGGLGLQARRAFGSENEETKSSVGAETNSNPGHPCLAAAGESRLSRRRLRGGDARLEINAQKKLRAKNCDAIVANDVSGSETGMESDENEVTIFFREGETRKFRALQKKL